MSRQRKIGLLVLFGALLLGLAAWFFGGELSEEDQVRQVIHQVADGAESADLGVCLEPFSARYSDPDGIDKNGIRGILWQQFNKRGPISVWMSPIEVQVTVDRALASFEVALVEGDSDSMIAWPVGAEGLHFEVELEKEDGDWHITSHTRQSVVRADTG